MNKKIIKNIIMVIASALLLLAATLAWFTSGDEAKVNELSAPISSINDVDIDHEILGDDGWVDINNDDLTTGKLIPGKEYRYRAIITAPETKDILGYSVSLEGVTIGGGEEGYDLRAYTYVKSYIGDDENDAPPENLEDYDYASYIGADSTDVMIIKVGDAESEVVLKRGEKVTIYYSLMLEGTDIAEHNMVSNATMDIGKVNIITMYDDATTNETLETETTTEA